MNIYQVEIVGDEQGFKGTWYRIGQRHFVTRNKSPVFGCNWHAIDLSGGILKKDAIEITGLASRLKCWFVYLQVKIGVRKCWAHGGVE